MACKWRIRHGADPGTRLLLYVCLPALLLFASVATQVALARGFAIDHALLLWFRDGVQPGRPSGPAWVLKAARDLTALGGGPVLTLVTVLGGGYLVARRQARSALLLILAASSGAWMNSALKHGFARVRPDVVPHLMEVSSASFPSAHAMNSAVIYLTLAALLAMAEPHRRVGSYLLGAALCLTLLIGLTRIYLGIHWPSDVLAGWSIGTAWAAGWTALAARLRQSGTSASFPG